MTKLADKWKQNYSLASLRDALFASLTNDDYIVYNSANQKWENKKQPRFGRDFFHKAKVGTEQVNGTTFVTYDTLNFTVSGPDTVNKFRLNANFFWGADSADNFQARILLDGSPVGGQIFKPPGDIATINRENDNILYYASNLSIGAHTFSIQYTLDKANKIAFLHRSNLEIWRVS